MFNVIPAYARLNLAHPINNGLVLHYRMDHGGGDWVRNRAGALDAQMNNMDPATDWIPWDNGLCLDFDGSNDYLTISTATTASLFTIEAMVKSRKNTGFYESIYVDTGGSKGFFLHNRKIEWYPGGAAGVTTLTQSQWYRVGITYDGTSIRAYIDGKLDGTIADASQSLPTSTPISIGGHGSSECLDGNIADLSVWNRCLSDSEMMENFQNPLGTRLNPRFFVKPRAPNYMVPPGGGGGIAIPILMAQYRMRR